MAKIQVAFCLLGAFAVMLQVDAGYLYPQKNLYDERLMDDFKDMDDADRYDERLMADLKDMDDADRYELSKRSCFDDPYYAPICSMFSVTHCNRQGFFTSAKNYNHFHTWCRRTCHQC